MQAFHIRYRNTQGTLMRILNAVSRRALDLFYVQAGPAGGLYSVTLALEVNDKQAGQLCRDWHAIVDVQEVRAGEISNQLADIVAAGPEVASGFAAHRIGRDSASAARA
jgi:acetolactate synthase small subunit